MLLLLLLLLLLLYYSLPEFNYYLRDHKPFVVFNQNIRSFNQNFESLSVFLSEIEKNIEIIVLTETWFTKDSCCSIEGYIGVIILIDLIKLAVVFLCT